MAGYRTPAIRRAAGYAFVNKPVNSVAPAITGTTTSGQTLTCSTGTWSKSPSFTYQWNRGGVAIAGANASTLVLAAPDVGSTMTCTVTATNAGVSAVGLSNTTATIA